MSKIVTNQDGKILRISFPKVLDNSWADEFVAESKAWLLLDVSLYVLDLEQVVELKPQFYRPVVVLAKLCRQSDRFIASINIKPGVLQGIKADGVLSSFNPMQNLDEAKQHAGLAPKTKPKAALDVRIINPFVTATQKTLEIQANTKMTAGKPYMQKIDDKGYSPPIGIAGVISISTEKFRGSVTLVFPEKVFLKIYENMFGEKHEKISGEIEDAAGEMLNIIYGSAKTELNKLEGFDLKPALPTVLSGEKIKIRQRTTEAILILPFETEGGPFQVEIAFEAI